ncbi:hypothetical protein OnM2_099011 [Erysiphe neolycopersici]|uniref:Uncharacterized protein n=1 Tax=Erysiphe neolycopersici TaxID=212602 RepID=A0A420HA13_9PEZI|nr:hypothetical protein OnM2_099011 [Erysiphe neolycopersici]
MHNGPYIEAVLRKELTNKIIQTDDVTPEMNSSALSTIQFCLDDRSFLQVKHIKRHMKFGKHWRTYTVHQEYLNRIKQLHDDLKAK